jgi:tetratricopeptide (TPR) repeat protein
LGKSYEALGDSETALTYYDFACKEAPGTREPWVEKAMCHYNRKEWQECYDCATQSLTIKDKQAVYTMDPTVWGAKPHDLAAISAYHLDLKDIAIKQGQEAVDLEPDDQRLVTNLNFYRHGHANLN